MVNYLALPGYKYHGARDLSLIHVLLKYGIEACWKRASSALGWTGWTVWTGWTEWTVWTGWTTSQFSVFIQDVFHFFFEACCDFGILQVEVVLFTGIIGQVIQLPLRPAGLRGYFPGL